MGLVQIIVVLVVVGIVLWLINGRLPIDPTIKLIINVVVVLAICIWLLRFAGVA
jgi:hypothetical protein